MFGRKPPPSGPSRFGEAAVAMGLLRPADVNKALRIQAHRQATGQPVPLLGEVLEGLGVLTDAQVQEVFEHLLGAQQEPRSKPRSGRPAPPSAGKGPARKAEKGPADTWWGRLKGRLAAG